MPARRTETGRNCRRPSTHMERRSMGTWITTRGSVGEPATGKGTAGPVGQAGAVNWRMRQRQADTPSRHKSVRYNITNISFQSIYRRPSANYGYSASGFQFVGSALLFVGHHRQMACGLLTFQPGGINLPAGPQLGCGLNSRQINHLQRNASETHYRGQFALAPCTGEIYYRW
jgi:hypothetical protein